jgi:signal transduction histidine kinase
MLTPLACALLILIAMGASALCWRMHRRARAEQADALALSGRLAMRERILALLAREMQTQGLALLGHAGGGASGISVAGNAQRLLDLSDELRELLAAEGRLRVVHAEPLRLLPILEAAVAATATQLGPARRDWRLAPEFAAMTLRADGRALRGAIEQVLARAARMTRDGDWIGLRPVITAESLTIIVEDEGEGLPVEDIAPETGIAGAGERTRGLGFGLAVARALLEAHGGSLRMEALQGVGARAWLTLPRDRLLPAEA